MVHCAERVQHTQNRHTAVGSFSTSSFGSTRSAASTAASEPTRLLQDSKLVAHCRLARAGGIGDLLNTFLSFEEYAQDLEITKYLEQIRHPDEFIFI